MLRLLARIDSFITANGLGAVAAAAEPLTSDQFDAPPVRLHAGAAGIRTVIWATGYRRTYPWLHVPVLDAQGEIAHAGGIIAAPGLYALGLRFMRRRKSNFIDGVGRDAEDLADHITGYLRLGGRRVA
jgi:putative flavoprotein involved in K+ transport